jgi:ribosomal protein S18 acetylase RimI-like enzyme
MSFHIRPARREDATFIAQFMLLAARSHLERGFWDITLAASEAKCLTYLERLACTETRSWAHHSNFIVAEVEGRTAAGLCCYDPQEAGTPALIQAMEEVADELGWDEAERSAPWERFAPISTCISDEAEGSWIVESVATLPAFRRRGLVNVLLNEALDKGLGKGYHLAQISVLIGNTPAQCAYERVGFNVEDEKRHPDFLAVMGEPGMRRLLRDL